MPEPPASYRFYGDLATWWPLISPPEEYAEETAFAATVLASASIPVREVLELGSGGGHSAVHLKDSFSMTLVDLSEDMLKVSARLNPECTHRQGDMRTVRLGRTFDAVFVHDAVDYMVTEADLRQAMETAFVHCRPGGVAVFIPDDTKESFVEGTDHDGHDGDDGRAVRFLEWARDPDPDDTWTLTDYAFLLLDPDGTVQVAHETHRLGLFGRDEWLRFLADAGLLARDGDRGDHRGPHASGALPGPPTSRRCKTSGVSGTRLRHALRADLTTIIDLWVDAFSSDTYLRWIEPDDERWPAFGGAWMSFVAELAFERGHTYLADPADVAAAWIPPDLSLVGPDDVARGRSIIAAHAGEAKAEDAFATIMIARGHALEEPHWTLQYLGVRSSRQGWWPRLGCRRTHAGAMRPGGTAVRAGVDQPAQPLVLRAARLPGRRRGPDARRRRGHAPHAPGADSPGRDDLGGRRLVSTDEPDPLPDVERAWPPSCASTAPEGAAPPGTSSRPSSRRSDTTWSRWISPATRRSVSMPTSRPSSTPSATGAASSSWSPSPWPG